MKDRGIRGYSSKSKDVLEKKVSEIKEKEARNTNVSSEIKHYVQLVCSSREFNVKSKNTISDCSRVL